MEVLMFRMLAAAGILALMTNASAAQDARMQMSVPSNSVTVTNWYKQSVYDPKDSKIGEIKDVLVDKSGRISSLIVAVGGFLGAGEKDVAVPFDSVRATTKNNSKWYLVMNATKDSLKNSTGFKYDDNSTTWVPDKK
jgi:sporulation protein YlmC with PRC-barrel domain